MTAAPADDTISRLKLRNEIERELKGKKPEAIMVEVLVDQRITRDAVMEVCQIVKPLQAGCPILNPAAPGEKHCGEDDDVEEIEAKSKMYQALSKLWIPVVTAIVSAIVTCIGTIYALKGGLP